MYDDGYRNINRQIIALHSTVGQYKVDVAEKRIHDINPECTVNAYKTFFMPDTSEQFDFSQYDYVIDAIDTVTGKIEIITKAKALGVPVISSMGAGNKLEASAFKVADIYKTKMCPLAKVMRYELKKRGVKKLKVVYSEEIPMKPLKEAINDSNSCDGVDTTAKGEVRKAIPGSISFVPSVAGLVIAGEVVKDLTGKKGQM